MRLRLLAVLFLLPVLFSCANRKDPVTGTRYYSPLGNDYESQVQYVRNHYLNQITTTQDGGDLNELDIRAACETVFRRVLTGIPAEHKRGFKFDLKISANTAVNAYTYGGGFVRCNLGLIAFCEDASELAGILAHELGHNSHDHIGQSVGRSAVSGEILSFGGLLGRPGAAIGNFLGGGIASFTLTQYTRGQEVQADERAVDYTSAASIDPDGLARFFARLATREGKGPPQLFQTHPYSANRVEDIRARIAQREVVTTAQVLRDSDAFHRAIDRARAILPYYEALHDAIIEDDRDAVLKAAQSGASALPHHAAFHLWAGTVLMLAEKPDEAVIELRLAAGLDTTNFLVPLVHAPLELQTGHPTRAEQSATQLIGLMPTMPQGYLLRGMARYALKRNEEAFTDFDAALDRSANRKQRKETKKKLGEVIPEYLER
jgi:predicted Zn-dependent protease